LNPLSNANRVTFIAIVPGVYTQGKALKQNVVKTLKVLIHFTTRYRFIARRYISEMVEDRWEYAAM